MPVKTNRYYNDPNIGAAFSNLAAAFAPPSGGDLAGYAAAAAKREDAARRAQLFENAGAETFDQSIFDRQAVAAGLYNPNQSYYSVGLGDATARRGQDISAETSRFNNAADNDRSMLEAILGAATGPVSQGAVRPGFNPADYGVNVPAVPEFAGRAAPLSETQWQAAQNERLRTEGALTDQMMLDAVLGDDKPVEAIGPDGQPVFMSPGAAVRGGATPAPSGSESARRDAVAVVNGRRVPVTRAPSGLEWLTADGMPIPGDAEVFQLPQATGSANDIGMTTSVRSGVQDQLISTQQTINTASTLRDMIQANPSSQGVAGMLRGTAQDIIQTGNELGQLMGAGVSDVNAAIRQGLADAGIQTEFFDPSIPAIEMMTNLLAWQYAKSMSGDRVSNEQLRQARQAIGGAGIFANQANSTARLGELIRALETQRQQLQSLEPNFGLGGYSNAPATSPATTGLDEPPTVGSPEEAMQLPSGTVFRTPDGQLKMRP